MHRDRAPVAFTDSAITPQLEELYRPGLRRLSLFDTQYAAEPDMGCRTVHGLGIARGRAVALAVIGRAQMRPALHDPSSDALFGIVRVQAFRFPRQPRPWRSATSLSRFGGIRRIPVDGPLPNIADHVVK